MPLLSRQRESGKILDNGNPIMLRGGHYDLFVGDKKPDRGLACPESTTPFELQSNGAPCPPNLIRPDCLRPSAKGRGCAKMLKWGDENLKWKTLFDLLVLQKINLLRVWLTNGTRVDATGNKPLDLYPFVSIEREGQYKWQVYQAVVRNQWNNEYFNRLTAFADAAALAEVNLQITLFNYQDLVKADEDGDFRAWTHSPWRYTLSDDPGSDSGWGKRHLVDTTDTDPARHRFFINPTNSLRVVQKAFVKKVVQVLKGRGNIIFEIMNEPRSPHDKVADFNSNVIEWIREAAGNWSPLISVNASNRPPKAVKFDTDWWQENSTTKSKSYVPNYDRVDIISYHGLTGFDSLRVEQVPGCNPSFMVAPTDRGHIRKRLVQHAQVHRQGSDRKALMYSTDAVISHPVPVLTLNFCDSENRGGTVSMQVRDGQVITNLANNSTEPEGMLAVKSDLQNWAYWCFLNGLGLRGGGTVHFHNHSGFESTYRLIHTALKQAMATPMPLGARENEET